jgi:geranylgeranyl reductase family protein
MHDVIVVGSGPSGASAAYELAAKGAKVLVLERFKLPRYKACGGLIPWTFFQTLPERTQRTLETSLSGGVCKGPRDKRFDVQLPCKAAGVMRDKFDYEFTRAAVDAGAELIEENPVLEVTEQPDKVTVRTKKGIFESRFLVGADGATGIVRKNLKLGWQSDLCPALDIEMKLGTEGTPGSPCLVDCAAVLDGYAWVFPKGAVSSVGLASFGRDRQAVRKRLADWMESSGYHRNNEVIHGHPIPVWSKRRNLATKRAVLVGDAAETVDPFLGEGIRYGIMSGRIAADFIAKGLAADQLPPGYSRAIHEKIQDDFVYARRVAAIFYRFPGLTFDLWVRSGTGAGLIGNVLYGEIRYKDLFKKAFRALVRPKAYRRLFTRN